MIQLLRLMQLSKCLTPVRVKLPNGDFQYVPCGKCEACRSLQAFTWKKRIDSEIQCNHWTLMFTLTYDDTHVPSVDIDLNGRVTYNFLESHPCLEVSKEVVNDLSKRYRLNARKNNYHVLCSSHYDIQDFIKRLKCYAPKIRWFIQTEVGPSTLRPHAHGLLFFNEYGPEYIKEAIFKAWPKCNWTLPENVKSIHLATSGNYCSSYVACVQSLPLIHSYKRFAQFRYTSNRPPIGSFVYSNDTLAKYKRAEVLFHPQYDIKTNEFSALPLLRSHKAKYFGRLPYYSLLSDAARKFLYNSYRYFAPRYPLERCNRKVYKYSFYAEAFSQWIEKYPSLYELYAPCLQSDSSLYHIYRVSKDYCTQRTSQNRLWLEYVYDMFDYNTEMLKLKEQYEYEEDFCNRRKLSPRWLVFKDAEFVRKYSMAFGLIPEWVEYTLSNYGYDCIEDFTANYSNYVLEKNSDCLSYFSKIHNIIHESHKSKENRSYVLKTKYEYLNIDADIKPKQGVKLNNLLTKKV